MRVLVVASMVLLHLGSLADIGECALAGRFRPIREALKHSDEAADLARAGRKAFSLTGILGNAALSGMELAEGPTRYLRRVGDGVVLLDDTGAILERAPISRMEQFVRKVAVESDNGHVLVDRAIYDETREALTSVPSSSHLTIVERSGDVTRTRVVATTTGDKRVYPVDATGRLLVPREIETESNYGWIRSLPFSRRDIRVIVALDKEADTRTVEALAYATRSIDGALSVDDLGGIEAAVERFRNKIVLLIGHSEGEELVVEGANGSSRMRISHERIRQLAEKNNATLVVLSCEYGDGGTLGYVNAMQLAEQVSGALECRTYSGFLSGLGSQENPIVLNKDLVGGAGRLVASRIAREGRVRRAGVEAAILLAVSRNTFRKRIDDTIDTASQALVQVSIWLTGFIAIVSALARSVDPVRICLRIVAFPVAFPVRLIRHARLARTDGAKHLRGRP